MHAITLLGARQQPSMDRRRRLELRRFSESTGRTLASLKNLGDW
jgi:hypothetical protein